MAELLKRRIGLGLLTAYGVGIMVGAGIYVLTGAAADAAGMWAPLAFLLAGLVAVPSALSFAELSARIPEAAGDSSYVEIGLNLHWLAVLVGLINVVAGTVAAAAVLRGGVGYLLALVDIPFVWGVVGLGVLLTVIALVGVLESLSFAAILTLVEVLGLCLVIWAGFTAEPVTDWRLPLPEPEWAGIAGAMIFAFFAFIGFDDMVNMAEETRNPDRVMPRSILLALAITAVLYALVSLAAVRAVPRDLLGESERPLALVWESGTGTSAFFLSAIAVAAALNGVLAQIVMASRVLYGLGKRSPWLALFRVTNKRFGTPVLGTVLIGVTVILSALTLPVATLAESTTQALLIVFAIVNIALIGVQRKKPQSPFRVPTYVPWLGAIACGVTFLASFVGYF
ncbi:APC family permease [Thalassovita sp.]|uniref:APC family permease n=1 Tax=Thalassovita sp. TaxID=1979401 RepID=UPI0029DE8389|nr:APC family permease [Thalassovita sp.]